MVNHVFGIIDQQTAQILVRCHHNNQNIIIRKTIYDDIDLQMLKEVYLNVACPQRHHKICLS
jgi:hypothetical protein